MTSHPYQPMRLPACADLAAVKAAQQAHTDARKLACPQCHAQPGKPCTGTGGRAGWAYSHIARRQALTAASHTPATPAAILTAAAAKAGAEPTVARAVAAGWSACHADPALIGPVFAAWCQAEDYASHPSGLGELLRRRHSDPAGIAASLRRAATLSELHDQPP